MPPPLEQEPDGGNHSAPEIRAPATVPEVGKVFTFQQTASAATSKNSKAFNVGLSDRDSNTLRVRVFIDGSYAQHLADLSVANCTKVCGAAFTIEGLCDEVVNNVLGTHVIEVYVSDMEWADADIADRRKLRPGALGVNLFWSFVCIPAVESFDAGS